MVGQYRDFDDFVARWLHSENITRQLHFAAQTDFLTDSLGHLAVDFIGYQEYLDRDYQRVCEHLGGRDVAPCEPQLAARHGAGKGYLLGADPSVGAAGIPT